MLKDITVYIKANLKKGGRRQNGNVSEANYIAYYGPIELGGSNKKEAKRNIVIALRKMYANGGLNSGHIETPNWFDDDDKYIIPASIIMQDVGTVITDDEIDSIKQIETNN